MWQDIVLTDIDKLADDIYWDVDTKGINIAFIVRYRMDHQRYLKPHVDSSLYTVAVALNKPGVDFKGGGVRFVRRNCTHIPPDSGHAIMHPGFFTHRHEGLAITEGTRYILVTFIN